MNSEETICKLCFKMANSGCEELDVTKTMLNVLLVELNWDLGEYSIICEDCENTVKRCYDFKSSLMQKTNQAQIKLDGSIVNITVRDYSDICQICSNPIANNKCFPTDNLLSVPKFTDLLPAFLPELDFNIDGNSLICIPCGAKLETYCKFISSYLTVKDKIRLYLRVSNKEATLRNIHEFLSENNGELPHAEMQINVKEEIVDSNDYRLDSDGEFLKQEDVNVEDDSTKTYTTKKRIKRNVSRIKKDFKCDQCPYVTWRKDLLQSHLRSHKPASEMETFKCESCAFQTKWKGSLRSHKLSHQSVSDVKMFSCESCAYKTKFNSHLKVHALIHEKDPFKCEKCSFTTKWKKSLNTHMLTHRGPSEVEMYKCNNCNFQTKYRDCIKRHFLIHLSVSTTKMYKCEKCPFQTRRRFDLEFHIETHKFPHKD